MTRKIWSIVALVVIFAVAIFISQYIPNMLLRGVFCAFCGALGSTIEKRIAKK